MLDSGRDEYERIVAKGCAWATVGLMAVLLAGFALVVAMMGCLFFGWRF